MTEIRKKTGGRQANTPNKINAQTRSVIQNLVSDEVQKIPELLDKLKPKDRIELIIKMLPFILPKQSKIELETDSPVFQTVIVQINESQKLTQ
jgi:hypothetical protein